MAGHLAFGMVDALVVKLVVEKAEMLGGLKVHSKDQRWGDMKVDLLDELLAELSVIY